MLNLDNDDPMDNDNQEDILTSKGKNNDSDTDDRGLKETENILSENGVFALAAMTSAATFPHIR